MDGAVATFPFFIREPNSSKIKAATSLWLFFTQRLIRDFKFAINRLIQSTCCEWSRLLAFNYLTTFGIYFDFMKAAIRSYKLNLIKLATPFDLLLYLNDASIFF